MLDEFAALGRLDFFESQLAFMAGYGIRSFLITQSLNQLERAYGPNHAILDNCHIRIAFSTNDERTAKRVSDALGTATEMRAMKNYAGHRLSPWLGHLMVSRQETSRPLLTPGEVMQLSPNEAIVMISGMRPVRARKVRYYEDPQLSRDRTSGQDVAQLLRRSSCLRPSRKKHAIRMAVFAANRSCRNKRKSFSRRHWPIANLTLHLTKATPTPGKRRP